MFLDILIPAITSILTAVFTWYAARRKNVAEAQSDELDNVEKAVSIYREMIDDMAKRHIEVLGEMKMLRQEIEELEKKVRGLIDENKELLEELKKYKQLNGKTKS